MTDRLDIIIFGATGFTGKHAIPILHKLSKSNDRNLTWGVAGRSEAKLKAVLKEMSEVAGYDLTSVPVIVADVKDEDSLKQLAERAKLVINCCGPFRFYGEPVVKACIAASTHHVDVSGEPLYMELMQLKYHKVAEEKGVYLISACGLVSLPVEMGTAFLQERFEGTLNSVITYLEVGTEEGCPDGPSLNYTTWHSSVFKLAMADELKAVRDKLFPSDLPPMKPKVETITHPHKVKVVDGWAVPFPSADRSVALRSQRFFYEKESRRPVQVEPYFVIKSLWKLFLIVIYDAIFKIFARFEFGRKLLLEYPYFFSGGFFSKDNPSEDVINKAWFKFTLYGEGWNEKLVGPNDEYNTPPNKSIMATIKGKNPGYGATNVCLLLAGIMTLTESDKMPGRGGVYSPGAAFAKTSLIKQLNENGVVFDLIWQKDI